MSARSNLGHALEEVLGVLLGAIAHHPLDAGAVVPAAIEQHDFAAGREVGDIALEIHCVASRSLGLASATTRHMRGLRRSEMARMAPPLPAVSRPSRMMRTRCPVSLTHAPCRSAPPASPQVLGVGFLRQLSHETLASGLFSMMVRGREPPRPRGECRACQTMELDPAVLGQPVPDRTDRGPAARSLSTRPNSTTRFNAWGLTMRSTNGSKSSPAKAEAFKA